MDKIKLNEKETRNLTAIKREDVKQLIKDIHYVLDELHFDEKLAYLPYYKNKGSIIPSVNPITDMEMLTYTTKTMLDKYVDNKWEINEPSDIDENLKLFNVLSGLKDALSNAKTEALVSSQFKDVYRDFNIAYYDRQYVSAMERMKNRMLEESGWVPFYHKGKIEYTNATNYNGKRVSLDKIERDDGKEILTAKAVQEKLKRGY